ncbi:tetratricopeptide repeat protein [Nostoc linckia]
MYRETGRYSQARSLYLQALKILERVRGVNHARCRAMRENLEKV